MGRTSLEDRVMQMIPIHATVAGTTDDTTHQWAGSSKVERKHLDFITQFKRRYSPICGGGGK
jgi:hypothetical protein